MYKLKDFIAAIAAGGAGFFKVLDDF